MPDQTFSLPPGKKIHVQFPSREPNKDSKNCASRLATKQKAMQMPT
jgi:hypothetical protein